MTEIGKRKKELQGGSAKKLEAKPGDPQHWKGKRSGRPGVGEE